MSTQTSKIEELFQFEQNEAKQEKSTVCLKSDKPRTESERRRLRGVGLACVALNIVIFVYRAFNSHAEGTVFSNTGETTLK